MRICPSCRRENADGADFCACGEYLRWEPTNYIPAVTAPATGSDSSASGAASEPEHHAPAPRVEIDPNVTLAPDAVASTAGSGLPPGASPTSPSANGMAPPGAAALTLRLPDQDGASAGVISVSVEPGGRVTLVGLIRNQSDVVDNFDLTIRGLPEEWWTIAPATAYLVPYGSGGTYEQEVQIHIHPPRTPQAQARAWSLEVVASSRAYGGEVVSAPATVSVAPYFEIVTELRPERASGRLKARFTLVVRNKANARTEVALGAEDTDGTCRFRFAQPSIALEPGNAIECPFTAFPPSQIWIGRRLDRPFQVTATPVGVDQPQPPRVATFRQRSWLPWWLAIVAPVVIVLAILAIKLLPKQTVVPNLKGQPTVFAAQKLLNKLGLQLVPKTSSVIDPTKPAGSIADQSPAAGTKAKRGTPVTVAVYAGTGMTTVPSLIGQTPGVAQQTLAASGGLQLQVSPQPLNPDGKIYAQVPLAGAPAANGSLVTAILAAPGASGKHNGVVVVPVNGGSRTSGAGGQAGSGSGPGSGSSSGSGSTPATRAGTGSIVIPALQGDPGPALAKLSQLGLVPTPVKQLSTAPYGKVAGTVPGPGAKLAPGAKVELLISNGSPQLSYDDGSTVHVIDPTTQKPSAQIPAGSGPQKEASWSYDGSHLVYSQNGELMLVNPNVKGAQATQLTPSVSGVANLDPSFAPTLKSLVIAFIQRSSQGTKLCFLAYTKLASSTSCTGAPGWDMGNPVNWSMDGSTILVLGTRDLNREFGLLAFSSSVHFSSRASNWSPGTPQTNVSVPGQGVVAGAFSPDGKSMALISNIGANDFQLYIAPIGKFNLTPAEEILPHACQVSWRSDSKALAVMQPAGPCNSEATGTIVEVDPANPRTTNLLASNAAHPAWQPVLTGG